MKFHSSKQQVFLLVIIFIATIGTTIGFSIFAPMFLHPVAGGLVSPEWSQKLRSVLLGLVIASYPIGQFFGSSVLGRLSDQYGRKPAMLYTLFGASVGYFFIGISLYEKTLSLLLFSFFCTGFLEGNISVARSSAADALNATKKHKNFGNISAAATAGSLLGPIIGGVLVNSKLVSWFSYPVPFYFSAIILLLVSLLCLFFFEETLSPDKRSKKLPSQNKYDFFSRIGKLGHTPLLKHYLMIWVVVVCAVDAFNLFLPAFLSVKWQMSPFYIAIFNAMLCIWYVIGSAWLVPYFATRLRTLTAINIGMALFAISLVLMLFPEKSYYLLPLFVICNLGVSLVLVNFFVYISDLTRQEHQGEVMGLALGLRMLVDGALGVGGGFLITVSVSLPVILSIVSSVIVVVVLMKKSMSSQFVEQNAVVAET